jgi:AAA domain
VRGVDYQVRAVLRAYDRKEPPPADVDWDIVAPMVIESCPAARGWLDEIQRGCVPNGNGAHEWEAPPLRFVRASEIDPQVVPVRWAADGLVLAEEITLVVGDGEVFKTTLLVAMAVFFTASAPLFDREEWATAGGKVLIITGEDAGPLLRNRIEALARGHGLDVMAVLDRIHILDIVGADFSIDRPKDRETVLAAIREIGPIAVMFDPHAELTSTPENDNDEVKKPIRFYRACATATGAAVIVAHHAGKQVEGKRKIDRIRGGSRLAQAARTVLFLERSDVGVAVEAIKFNRAERPKPFVLESSFRADPANPGIWLSARFRYLTQFAATEQSADQFVLGQLTHRGRLNTSELKEIAKTVPGVSGADVSGALKRLAAVGRIDHQPGAKGAKLWGIADATLVAGQPGQPETQRLPGKDGQPGQPAARPCLPPLGGQGGSASCEQPDFEDYEAEFLAKRGAS